LALKWSVVDLKIPLVMLQRAPSWLEARWSRVRAPCTNTGLILAVGTYPLEVRPTVATAKTMVMAKGRSAITAMMEEPKRITTSDMIMEQEILTRMTGIGANLARVVPVGRCILGNK